MPTSSSELRNTGCLKGSDQIFNLLVGKQDVGLGPDVGDEFSQLQDPPFEGKVRAPRSLLLRSALAEARVVRDTAGNEKLAKGSQSGRRALARDDAAAALVLAVAEGIRRGVPERPALRLVAV